MIDKTPTEQLRKGLTKCGVKWKQGMAWNVTHTDGWMYVEDVDTGLLSAESAYDLTPEQAIAATVGAGTCRISSANEYDGFWWAHLTCGHAVAFAEKWLDDDESSFPARFCPVCGRQVAQ